MNRRWSNTSIALLFIVVIFPLKGRAQKRKVDSLFTILKNEKEDTNKVRNLDNLAFLLHIKNPDTSILIAQEASDLAIKLNWKKGEANSYNNFGLAYWLKGNYSKALEYYLKALKLNEEIGDKHDQAVNLANIGNLYDDQGDYVKALDYDLKALKINEEIGRKQGQAINLGNIGNIYGEKDDFPKALEYYQKALKLDDELGDRRGQAYNLGNIGFIYFAQRDFLKALDYYLKSSKICEEIQDKQRQSINFGNIGILYTKTGKFKEAELYLKKAIVLDSSISDKNDLRQNEEGMSHLYDTVGQYKLALLWYKKAMVLKDTLFNIDKNKDLTRKEVSYQYDKKEAAEKAAQDKKDAQQRVIIWSVVAGLLLVLVFAGFILRSLRITSRQKQVIEIKSKETEEQKKVIEEKQKDILDSITYAKRLQDAILPPLSLVKQYLPDSFLLFKPKDIVAGDFYWMERAGHNILIAAADCTGHGVPGAMVSVVCSNALNRTVKEFKITEPGKILDKVRELVLETFEKSEDNVQDGMDISLCCLNTKTNEAQWSGAYNSLWYIQNGEAIEVLADKQPIGKVDKPLPFNTHNLNLQKGDTLYLFTDGYADQFGGPKGKKFKYKQLQELLLANTGKTMDMQKEILEAALYEWKGALEQVDDILVIGVRL